MDTNPTGRIMLEASAGMHGEIAQTIAKEWAALAGQLEVMCDPKRAAILANLTAYEAPPLATDADGFICEMALQHGAEMLNDDGSTYAFTQEQLLAFTKANRGPVQPIDPIAEPAYYANRIERSLQDLPDGNTVALHRDFLAETAAALRQLLKPLDMVLFCPNCGLQHVDATETHNCKFPACDCAAMEGPPCMAEHHTWTNPPHRSHLCHGCAYIWRPADVPTNGVQAIKTRGKADSGPSKFTMLPDPPQPIGTAGVALIRAVSGLVAIPKGGA